MFNILMSTYTICEYAPSKKILTCGYIFNHKCCTEDKNSYLTTNVVLK